MDPLHEYSIIKQIGHGEYGSVYLVSHANEALYAMKTINKYKSDPDHRLPHHSELTLLPNLSHPNIVKTVHVEENQHQSFVILQYASKGDLHSYMTQFYPEQPIPQSLIVKWLCQLSLGLHYLHNKARVLHRDIKTKNILVMDNEILKLADFGTAKQLMKNEQFAMTAVGTPYYLSPQAIQLSKYNCKSDIWGLGCVMFELCTGKKPFQAANLRQLINKILNDPLQQIPNNYSEWLRKLISQMLTKNPQKRPTAQSILEQGQIRSAFAELREKYPEYEEMGYPVTDLKTKKYEETKKTHFCRESLKTAKNEQRQKSIRLEIENEQTTQKVKAQMSKRVEREKFAEKSLKALIEKRKQKQSEGK